MTGRFTFHSEPMFRRTSQRMGVQEQVVNIRARQHGTSGPSQNVTQALTQGLRDTVQRFLDQQRMTDGDRFYLNLSSDRLRNASNASFLTAREWRRDQARAKDLLDNLARMLNSQEQFEVEDSFNVRVRCRTCHHLATPRFVPSGPPLPLQGQVNLSALRCLCGNLGRCTPAPKSQSPL